MKSITNITRNSSRAGIAVVALLAAIGAILTMGAAGPKKSSSDGTVLIFDEAIEVVGTVTPVTWEPIDVSQFKQLRFVVFEESTAGVRFRYWIVNPNDETELLEIQPEEAGGYVIEPLCTKLTFHPWVEGGPPYNVPARIQIYGRP